LERTGLTVGDEELSLDVDGRTVTVVSRPADGDHLAQLFELGRSPAWDDASPMSDLDVTRLVRNLMEEAGRQGKPAGVLGVPPAAARAFPNDPRIYVSPVEPVSFSLPGSPSGLVFHMDDQGNGHVWALGDDRVSLGSDGMWWIVNALISALGDPATTSGWPRFLTLGTTLGGPATQASLEYGDWGVGIVWRKLRSGVVGDIVAVHELSYERVEGWLRLLGPVRLDIEAKRAHRQRLRPARTAEKWARALERWSV
jgi:hypothetical protein